MIYGKNPFSLIDYPKNISYVIFLGGCNFRCSYCHNKDIVNENTKKIKEEEVLNELKQRKKIVKAITITGGEPTIHGKKLINFIKKIKDLGLKVKLDTNGTNPEVIEKLVDSNLIDYIAMDIKNTYDKYFETIGVKVNLSKIRESIKLIENCGVNYQFRSTVNKDMHSIDDINEMLGYVKDSSMFVLQPYKYSENQLKDIHYTEYSEEDLENIK
ncbi:MAG: anaerobic ribonucleoside-triphosphate reductase activating protein [bacterium]